MIFHRSRGYRRTCIWSSIFCLRRFCKISSHLEELLLSWDVEKYYRCRSRSSIILCCPNREIFNKIHRSEMLMQFCINRGVHNPLGQRFGRKRKLSDASVHHIWREASNFKTFAAKVRHDLALDVSEFTLHCIALLLGMQIIVRQSLAFRARHTSLAVATTGCSISNSLWCGCCFRCLGVLTIQR